MPLRWFLRDWIQRAAGQKLREAAIHAVQDAAQGGQRPAVEAERPWTCDVGIVFAMEVESGGLEDLLSGVATLRGPEFVARHGMHSGRSVVLFHSGAGREAAAKATEALLVGHRPTRVIAAGFSGGLDPGVARHDLVVASGVVDEQGATLALPSLPDTPSWGGVPRCHVGRVLTVDRVLRLPREKAAWGKKYQALAADMESFDVARVCQQRQVPCLVVRVITDALNDELPPDMERLARQKTAAARWGAAVGSLWNRPSSLKDMWGLREGALVAGDRLAGVLSAILEKPVSGPTH